jgi:hypothetical protein
MQKETQKYQKAVVRLELLRQDLILSLAMKKDAKGLVDAFKKELSGLLSEFPEAGADEG